MLPPQRITAARAPAAAARGEQGGQRRRARTLRQLVGVARGPRESRVPISSSVTSTTSCAPAPDDLQRRRHRHPDRHPVGPACSRSPSRPRCASGTTARRRWRRSKLDADDPRRQPERVARGDQSADPRAAADRHVDRVDIGHGPKQLQRVGADTGDEFRLERADEFQPLALGDAGRVPARLVEIAAEFDQLGTERTTSPRSCRASCRVERRSRSAGRAVARRTRGSAHGCRAWR